MNAHNNTGREPDMMVWLTWQVQYIMTGCLLLTLRVNKFFFSFTWVVQWEFRNNCFISKRLQQLFSARVLINHHSLWVRRLKNIVTFLSSFYSKVLTWFSRKSRNLSIPPSAALKKTGAGTSRWLCWRFKSVPLSSNLKLCSCFSSSSFVCFSS